jgi:hypothetical protein
VQILVTENNVLQKQINNITTKRDINDQSILKFQLLLSHENWEEMFMEDDANIFFNTFLNIYLMIFIPASLRNEKTPIQFLNLG